MRSHTTKCAARAVSDTMSHAAKAAGPAAALMAHIALISDRDAQVTLVVNYDMPVERDLRTPAFETYLHRIGRSGRFGRKGAAFNFVTGDMVRVVMPEMGA